MRWFLVFTLIFHLHGHAISPELPKIAGDRIALIFGNSQYQRGSLLNPSNDARVMAELFRQKGFEVQMKLDATADSMREMTQGFKRRLADDAVAMGIFYYAGHGMQMDWRNFLLGVDAKISKIEVVSKFSLELNDVVKQGSEDTGIKGMPVLLIVDACRD